MALLNELATAVVETLNLGDVSPDTITRDTTFFKDGLGLDSIDILELVVIVEQRWGVRIDNQDLGKEVFQNMGSLVDYITAERAEAAAG